MCASSVENGLAGDKLIQDGAAPVLAKFLERSESKLRLAALWGIINLVRAYAPIATWLFNDVPKGSSCWHTKAVLFLFVFPPFVVERKRDTCFGVGGLPSLTFQELHLLYVW